MVMIIVASLLGWVAGLVVLRLEVAAFLVEQKERFLPRAGNAIGFNV